MGRSAVKSGVHQIMARGHSWRYVIAVGLAGVGGAGWVTLENKFAVRLVCDQLLDLLDTRRSEIGNEADFRCAQGHIRAVVRLQDLVT